MTDGRNVFSGVNIVAGRTAVVITDSQNDFLSPKGVTWGVVGKSVTENNTVENIESLFEEGNGYESVLVDLRFIANTVWTTREAVKKINAVQGRQ